MASKIHEEIHALVPEPIKKGGYGIYWNERSGRYYVYRDLAHVYSPKTKRSAVLEMVSLPTVRLG